MAFTDPQSITIDGSAVSMARVLTGTSTGRFVSADQGVRLQADPRQTSRRRRNVARVDKDFSVPVPGSSGLTTIEGVGVSLLIDRPRAGVSDADVQKLASGFLTWLTANTNANLLKIINGEN